MSRHARIEEISSSEEEEDSDPEIMDPGSLAVLEPVRPRQQQQASASSSSSSSTSTSNPLFQRQQQQQQQQPPRAQVPKADHTWITLYPLYFDASASRAQGRRVDAANAVANPLAKTLADAAAQYVAIPASLTQRFGPDSDAAMRAVQAKVILEPAKRHPADWANPGRVRVKVRDEAGGAWAMGGGVKNKRMLYKAIASYLKKYPTTAQDPFDLPIRGMPMPEGDTVPPPAKPRGWRLNDILPLHSPAMTGGGVSDNIMKDLQAAMGGQDPSSALAALTGGGGSAGSSAAAGNAGGQAGRIEGKKKKDKKKK